MSTWVTAVDAFDQHLADSDRSEATCAGYIKHLAWLAESAPAGPWDLDTHQLAAWLDGKNWSRETRRKVLVSIRAFYAWAVAEGHVEWAPTAGIATNTPRKPGPQRKKAPPAWEGPLDDYLSWLRAGGRTEGTLKVRRWWLGRIAEVSSDPWSVTTQQLAQLLSTSDWKPEFRRAGLSSVRSFYRWAVISEHLDVSPAERLDPVQRPRVLPRPAPDAALREALSVADDRQRLAIKLGAYAGLRRAEIANVHTRHIGQTEILVVGKGGHHRRVPLHPDLAAELQVEMARRREGRHGTGWSGPYVSDTGYLFPSSNHPGPLTPAHLAVIIGRCLPPGLSCHTLRHRFATEAYSIERDLRAVQELLGHAKPETTAIYAAVPDGALRCAVTGIRALEPFVAS